jgi:hypothetical protein
LTHYLSTSAACAHFHVSRGKLAQMRRDGLVRAVNINPGGDRAVWRYADRLEVVDAGNMEKEMLWQDFQRRCGG